MDEGKADGNRPSEWIAAPGDQRDVDAGGDRGVNRIAILIRQPSLAVEQRAVDVDANQSNHAQFRGPQQFRPSVGPPEGGHYGPSAGGYDRKVMTLGPFEGVNAGYVLELYERYRQNPESVDPATREAFKSWTPTDLEQNWPVRKDRPYPHPPTLRRRLTSTSSLAPRTSSPQSGDSDIWPRTSIRSAPTRPAIRRCRRAHTASLTTI